MALRSRVADRAGRERPRLERILRVAADRRYLLRERKDDGLVRRGGVGRRRVLPGSDWCEVTCEGRLMDLRTWCCVIAAISGLTAFMLVHRFDVAPTEPELRSSAR